MGFFSKQGREARRGAREQKRLERFKARVSPILQQGEIETAQLMVVITDDQVRKGRLHTEEQLRRDFAAEPSEVAKMLAYHVQGLELMRASPEWGADPLTPQVDAQTERKIAVLRDMLARGPQ